jgi:hypothetical protein
MTIGAISGTTNYSSGLESRVTVVTRAKSGTAAETDTYEGQNASGSTASSENKTSSATTTETKSSREESSASESSGKSKSSAGGSGSAGSAAAGGGTSSACYDPADTNRDGVVSAEEARKYAGNHPTKAARYEQAASSSTSYGSQGKMTSPQSSAATLEVYA